MLGAIHPCVCMRAYAYRYHGQAKSLSMICNNQTKNVRFSKSLVFKTRLSTRAELVEGKDIYSSQNLDTNRLYCVRCLIILYADQPPEASSPPEHLGFRLAAFFLFLCRYMINHVHKVIFENDSIFLLSCARMIIVLRNDSPR